MPGQFVLVIAIVLAAVGALALYLRHKRELADAHARLLARDGLVVTNRPCGRGAGELRHLRACPEGDRNYGVELGVTGPCEVTMEGTTLSAECAAFVWWWEEERRHHNKDGPDTVYYVKQDRVIGMIQVPYQLPAVSIGPEGMFARMGIGGRGDFQVESEEFNRHFDVRIKQPELGIRLLDAQFQRFLLEMFAGRHLEFNADIILVAGDPAGADPELYGHVKELPGARRDAQLVAARVPPSFWRALRHDDRDLRPADGSTT